MSATPASYGSARPPRGPRSCVADASSASASSNAGWSDRAPPTCGLCMTPRSSSNASCANDSINSTFVNGEQRRVVVTGLGMITPLGASVEKTWAGLKAGKSGISRITRFDAKDLETQIAGEVHDFDALEYMDRKEAKRADRFAQFAIATAGQ